MRQEHSRFKICGRKSSIHFYQKCLDKRLCESDFYFSKDGTTNQKLDIIEQMMNLKKKVTMIGDSSEKIYQYISRCELVAFLAATKYFMCPPVSFNYSTDVRKAQYFKKDTYKVTQRKEET